MQRREEKGCSWMRRITFCLLAPILFLMVFVFFCLIIEPTIAGITGCGTSFSDYEQAAISRDYVLAERIGFEIFDRHTDDVVLNNVSQIYYDGDAVIASCQESGSNRQEMYYLYRLEKIDNQNSITEVDSSNIEENLWTEYTIKKSIPMEDVLHCIDFCGKKYNRNLLISSILSFLIAGYVVFKFNRKMW